MPPPPPGYPLEPRALGFSCLEELLTSPALAATLRLSWRDHWELGLAGEVEEVEDYTAWRRRVAVPRVVEERLGEVLASRPAGLEVAALPLAYTWAALRPADYDCSDLVELCLALPATCRVERVGEEYRVVAPHFRHPVEVRSREEAMEEHGAGAEELKEKIDTSIKTEGEVKTNAEGKGKSGGDEKVIERENFANNGVSKAAESLNQEIVKTGKFDEVVIGENKAEDVNKVEPESDEKVVKDVDKVKEEAGKKGNRSYDVNSNEEPDQCEGGLPPDPLRRAIKNVARTLREHVEGVRKEELGARYLEVVGEELEVRSLGFFNTSAFLRYLVGTVVDLRVLESKEVMVTLRESKDLANTPPSSD